MELIVDRVFLRSTVSTTAIDSELAKLSAATERLFDVHAEVARNAVALRQTRASADALLRVSADMNAELKRAQEPLKAAKREAQRRRDRWIDLEQSIAEAPERRKRITEQLTQRESQEEEAANKIAAIQKVLAEEQASHDDAAAASKESETAIHIIETTIADLEKWESSTRQQEQEGDLVEGSEVAIICSRLSGYIKEREAFKDLLKNSGTFYSVLLSHLTKIMPHRKCFIISQLANYVVIVFILFFRCFANTRVSSFRS